jgi:hypothetical protein
MTPHLETIYFVGLEVLTAVAIEFYLMGYNAMESTESQPIFRRNVSSPSSELNSKPRKKPA